MEVLPRILCRRMRNSCASRDTRCAHPERNACVRDRRRRRVPPLPSPKLLTVPLTRAADFDMISGLSFLPSCSLFYFVWGCHVKIAFSSGEYIVWCRRVSAKGTSSGPNRPAAAIGRGLSSRILIVMIIYSWSLLFYLVSRQLPIGIGISI